MTEIFDPSGEMKRQMETRDALEQIKTETGGEISKFFPDISLEDIDLQHRSPELPAPAEDKFIGEYIKRIKEVIIHYLDDFGADGITIGVSGGIDSSLCLKLCSDALKERGDKRVLRGVTFGRISKEDFARLPRMDKAQIQALAQSSGSSVHEIVDLYYASKIHQEYTDLYNYAGEYYEIGNVYDASSSLLQHKDPFAAKELIVRIQALMINQVTQEENHVYFGTTNRTENLLGALTIGGPWGYLPLQDGLYKTETYYAAKKIGVPRQFINRRPINGAIGGFDDDLYGGTLDLHGEDFFRLVDPVLYLYDQGFTIDQTVKATGHNEKFIRAIYERVINNTERRYPREVVVDKKVKSNEGGYYSMDIAGEGELGSRFLRNKYKMTGSDETAPATHRWEDISPVIKEGRRATFEDINQGEQNE